MKAIDSKKSSDCLLQESRIHLMEMEVSVCLESSFSFLILAARVMVSRSRENVHQAECYLYISNLTVSRRHPFDLQTSFFIPLLLGGRARGGLMPISFNPLLKIQFAPILISVHTRPERAPLGLLLSSASLLLGRFSLLPLTRSSTCSR